MAPRIARERKHLSKNKSVKLFKEKQKRRDAYANQRQNLLSKYDEINTSQINTFNKFPLTAETQRGLQKCNYVTPTEIQLETIALALKKHDILGAAKTGSGKTLAFVIPILERLFCEGWCQSDGLGALVITPTRELAAQIYQVCCNVGQFHDFTKGLFIGGQNLRKEKKSLHLYNIVICTPGRLLQHMDENPLFNAMNLQMLILDEADRILDMGFQKEVNAIIEHLPVERQTMLFSATQTKSVKDLARLSLKDPSYVAVHENAKHATPESLEQSYMVCPLSKKMDFLWSFVKNHKKQKIIVFMATCKQVKYTFDIFCRMKPGISLTALYGGLHQQRRLTRYEDFCKKTSVVMFATDIAARGLDFPNVNWVVQLDCPEDTNTYIHRAGRTARYHKGGEALIVLLPSEEESMLKQLEDRKIPINEIKVHPSKILSVQRKMAALCARDPTLKESAQRAFKSYYKNIFLMKDKTIFDINVLNETNIREPYAHSLGLENVPRIRFIEKHNKKTGSLPHSAVKNDKELCDSEKKKMASSGFDASDESEDDDFLKPKKSSHLSLDDDDDDEEMLQEIQNELYPTGKKAVTKAALAKKILKKKIKATVIKFDDEGEAIEDIPKSLKTKVANKLAEDMAEEGYSVEKAKKLMEAEDEVDKTLYRVKIKEKHKVQRRKLKEQRRQEHGNVEAQLSEVGNRDDDENSGGDDDDDASSNEEEEQEFNQMIASGSEDDENSNGEDDHDDVDDSGSCSEPEKSSRKRKRDSVDESRGKKLAKQTASLEDEELLALHFLENT